MKVNNSPATRPSSTRRLCSPRLATVASLIAMLGLATASPAQTTPPASAMPPKEEVVDLNELVIETNNDDPAGVMPNAPISSVFGTTRPVLETPRSVSVVSSEMLEQYGVDNIEGLAAIVPSSYTTSSFGIAGSLDLRGTGGENYFRGMKRIENGGVYPTPIGATDRVDVVRGPPSPVFGPGKIGGYLNFIPKAARASTGKYLRKPTGKAQVTYGSWEKQIATIEQGGPLPLKDRDAGYYVYMMMENSGSWYRNAGNEQFLVQSSFDIQINDTWRTEFGQQYHKWASIEISGINRLTQAYIDNGTYIAGHPVSIDTNADGLISPAEFNAAGGVSKSFAYGTSAATVRAGIPASWALIPGTISTVQLPGNSILSDQGDFANAKSALFFADLINDKNPNLTFKNQVLVDTLKRKKDTSQGFGTKAQAFQVENKFTAAQKLAWSDTFTMENTASASFKYFDGQNMSYTAFQPFNRRDLYTGASIFDRIVSANDDPVTAPWTANRNSTHYTYGLGVLSDMSYKKKINLTLGAREDAMSIWGITDPNSSSDSVAFKTVGARNHVTGFSYSASASYAITPTIIPYYTISKQRSLQIGNIGDITTANVATPITPSNLVEAGLKATLLKDKLFAAVAAYRQTRSAINPDTFESFTTQAEGTEFELRYLPMKRLSISGSANWQKTIYLRPPASFTVPAEFFGVDPTLAYGGSITVTNIPATAGYLERGGLPDKVFSLNGTYTMENGFGITLGSIYQASMTSGSAKVFMLPSVLKFDGAIFYTAKSWDVRVRVNNITNERYFQSNGPDNNGNTVAIQKLPRNSEITFGYRF